MARLLATAWRAAPSPPGLDEAGLLAAVPLVLRTGAGPLAWWRLRGGPLAATEAAGPLRDAYRHEVLMAAVREHRLPGTVAALAGAGGRAVVAKGWAVARHYPETGLRPYGDVDLYVNPSDGAAAREALGRSSGLAVDVHRGFPDLDDRDSGHVLARAQTALLGGAAIPVLAPEDHLRLLCRHLLRHGAARPLWLCDVALLVESRPPGFDWDLFLAGSHRRREALLDTLALAGVVLGADLAGTPAAGRPERLPSWLVPTLLREWGRGVVRREPLLGALGRPGGWSEARRHWPNGIQATAALDAPFNGLPRLPFQAVHALGRLLAAASGRKE